MASSRLDIARLLGGGALLRQLLVPRPRKTALVHHLGGEDLLMPRPLCARQLVIHLDAVAVRIAEIDAERHPVIGDALDRYLLLLDPTVEFLQIVEAVNAPSHMVQPDLS